jgi:hypothetical protein
MNTLTDALNSLDPPVKHELLIEGDYALLLLCDPLAAACVQRKVQGHEMHNPTQFRLIVLYAVNELRRKGSHAELKVLPAWD